MTAVIYTGLSYVQTVFSKPNSTPCYLFYGI